MSKPNEVQAAFLRGFIENVIEHGLSQAMDMYETCYDDPDFYENEEDQSDDAWWRDEIHGGSSGSADNDGYMPIGALFWEHWRLRKDGRAISSET